MSQQQPPSNPDDPLGAHVAERLRRALEDRYALEDAIAQGGMGLVFRARDLRHPRWVAVKVLPPELGTAVAFERFVQEIRTHAALHHPHILGFIESGDAGGLPFYIMPLVDGESLRDRLLREHRLAVREAARIVRDTASALDYAHAHGVVHRDVKPENVLLVDGRHVLIADFGLAHAVLRSTNESLTRSGTIVGTTAYMSPEQASGGEVDGRADVYSLGCVLYEMLAGRTPFVADNPMAVLAQHMATPAPRISDGTVVVPAAVEDVVHRALEKDPARRWQTALALSEALDAAVATTGTRGRMRPWQVAAATGGLALVALVVALASGSVSLPGRDGTQARAASSAARSAYERGRVALADWDLDAADSVLSQAVAADGSLAAAHLALAEARSWRGDRAASWRAAAQRAYALQSQLSARDRALAAALQHMAAERFPDACAIYDALRRDAPADFAAAFGAGECRRLDEAVVPDSATPSRWRFRGSAWQAMLAYRSAFELEPRAYRAFEKRGFERIRSIFLTSTSTRVEGRALAPDSTRFRAATGWAGDSVVLVPWPREVERRDPVRTLSRTAEEAVTHTRRMFRDIAASWRRAFPDEATPREALAIAMELMGEPTALDTLRDARRLAADPEQRVRLAAREVWTRVKFALPDDTAGLARARALADSLLGAAASPSAEATETLAGIALLVGHANMAAALARRAAPVIYANDALPPGAIVESRALLAYAAVGAPAESLRAIEAGIERDVRSAVAPRDTRDALVKLLGQAAGLAFPVQPLHAHETLAGPDNPLLVAQWMLRTGDRAVARRTMAERGRVRASRRPAELPLDVTFTGAWTLHALGEDERALEWIAPALDASRFWPQEVIARVASAGTLVRALALRADLAAAAGDAAGARRWARPVPVLWRDADPALQPLARRMAALVDTPTIAMAR